MMIVSFFESTIFSPIQKAQEHSFVRRNAVTPDMLPCIVAGIFANLGHDIMARMGRYGRRTQSTGINRGCRSRPTQLECGQRRLPSAESDGLLRHNIRLTRDRNWNCGGFCKVGKRLPEGPHKRRGGAAARCRRHRSSEDARRRHRRSPRTRTPLNGLTKKCSSEHRCGRGTLLRQSRKATPGGDARAARRSGSEMSQTSKQRRRPAKAPPNGLTKKCSSEHRCGRGTLLCKVGKRLPQGPHKRRGGATARCRRHRSSGDARRRHRRSRLAPERGCHEVTGLR